MIVPLKCPILVFFPAKAMFDDTIGQVDQENTSFVLTRLNISDISEPHPPDLPSLGGNVGNSATWTSQAWKIWRMDGFDMFDMHQFPEKNMGMGQNPGT